VCVKSNAFLVINLDLGMFTIQTSNTVASTCQYVVLPRLHISSYAGVLVKDQRHRDSVEEAGCDFIPLVVETFGVWSPLL